MTDKTMIKMVYNINSRANNRRSRHKDNCVNRMEREYLSNLRKLGRTKNKAVLDLVTERKWI